MPSPHSSSGRRAVVTGITGQDGSYLAELLLAKGYEVWGLRRRTSTPGNDRIEQLLEGSDSGLHLVYGDLADAGSIGRLLHEAQPHEVYNLGAQSHVQVSFAVPEYTADVTGLGAVRILEALRQSKLDARFYQASSSELFGGAVETPQRETTPFHPRSPYAAAKAYAFHITRNYREAYGMFAVNGILFNHESPRRGENFVTRKISLGVARIAQGRQEKLLLGNLDARRDWGFAGDYVEAMWSMLQLDTPDDFVVATGESHSVREFCELAFAEAGRPIRWSGDGAAEQGLDGDGAIRVEIDRRFLRPADVECVVGDAGKARKQLGWAPRVDFEGLVRMMVREDLQRVSAEVPPEGAPR